VPNVQEGSGIRRARLPVLFRALPEGTGIVADDLAAGIYGALVLLVAGWLNQ